MKKYIIQLKPPSSQSFIWAGPQNINNTIPNQESDKQRTKRLIFEKLLKKVAKDGEFKWFSRRYCYEATLSEEQAEELKQLLVVRSIKLKE